MRVQARRALIIDSVIGLILALTSWMASFYVWGRPEFNRSPQLNPTQWGHGPPGRMVTTVDPSPYWRWASRQDVCGRALPSLRQRGASARTWPLAQRSGRSSSALPLVYTRWQVAPESSPTRHLEAPPVWQCHRSVAGRHY
jgi:hypothetical protein